MSVMFKHLSPGVNLYKIELITFNCVPEFTCSDWVAAGLINSFIVDVDPDGDYGEDPFKVYCDVTSGINGSTTISEYK